MAIEFFGEVDKNSKGEISSEMPSWFHDQHLDYLEEGVAKKKRQILRDEIPQETIHTVKNEIKKQEKKIKQIKVSIPKLIGGQKDKVAKAYHELKNIISDDMPTEYENKKGTVKPQEELKRWKIPHIKIDPELAKACNVKTTNGKVTGDGAAKMYRLMGKRLGENYDIERIRRPGHNESYQTMQDITKHILENKLQGA